MLLLYGLGRGEVLGLRWSDIDGDTIHIRQQVQRINGRLHSWKPGRIDLWDERDISLPRPALVPPAVAAARNRVNEDSAGREPPPADTSTVLEHAGIRMTLAAGFVKGGIEVATAGPGRSTAAAAMTMLILTGAAVLSSTAVGFVLWLAHAPSLLLGEPTSSRSLAHWALASSWFSAGTDHWPGDLLDGPTGGGIGRIVSDVPDSELAILIGSERRPRQAILQQRATAAATRPGGSRRG